MKKSSKKSKKRDSKKTKFLKLLNAIANQLDDVADYSMDEYPVNAIALLDAAKTIVESVIERVEVEIE